MARHISCASVLVLALALLACGERATAPMADEPLRVLFLGEKESPRTEAFASFLGERFGSVDVADRWAWDRSVLADVDVVVLDWPQEDGISKWMLAGDRTVPPRSPLGTRASWRTPTVLVGSAGLNTAWAWDVKGAFG